METQYRSDCLVQGCGVRQTTFFFFPDTQLDHVALCSGGTPCLSSDQRPVGGSDSSREPCAGPVISHPSIGAGSRDSEGSGRSPERTELPPGLWLEPPTLASV